MLRLHEVNATRVVNFGGLMFVPLPLLAFCLKVAAPRRSLPYDKQLFFSLHPHRF